jgi:hypothetical protein
VREGIMPPSLATREIALMGSDCRGLALEFSPGFEPLFSI